MSANSVNESEILVKFASFMLLQINGQSAENLKLPATTRALMNAMPSYLVSKQSVQIVKVIKFDEMIKKILEAIPDEPTKNRFRNI